MAKTNSTIVTRLFDKDISKHISTFSNRQELLCATNIAGPNHRGEIIFRVVARPVEFGL